MEKEKKRIERKCINKKKRRIFAFWGRVESK
jgi:hypothetical protein